jgi:outer membrane protein OmpA-like peptidoglycan-associated protein
LTNKIKYLRIQAVVATLFFLIPLFACGQSTTVETLYFASNKYGIDRKYNSTLDNIGRLCTTDKFEFLKIFAYADKKGSIAYNEQLSKKRAETVYNYLTKHFDFDTTKVFITWLGEETDGAYDLHFPDAHFQQRCVDIIITLKQPSN